MIQITPQMRVMVAVEAVQRQGLRDRRDGVAILCRVGRFAKKQERGDGTVYEKARPGVLVRITGQAPVTAKVYQLQKLRCHLCGKVFTAQSPEGIGSQKYDATAKSIIALLKYGTGMPWNRSAGLQGDLGIPLAARPRDWMPWNYRRMLQ